MMNRGLTASIIVSGFLLLSAIPAPGTAAEFVITETEQIVTVEYTGMSETSPAAPRNSESKIDMKGSTVQGTNASDPSEKIDPPTDRRMQRQSRQRPAPLTEGGP